MSEKLHKTLLKKRVFFTLQQKSSLVINVAFGSLDNHFAEVIESVVDWRSIVIVGCWAGARVFKHEPLRFVVDQHDSANNRDLILKGIHPLENNIEKQKVSHTI
jgi:hypothetical protein